MSRLTFFSCVGVLFTAIFTTLKLCAVIHWSWTWVVLPSLLPQAIYLSLVGIVWYCERHLRKLETPLETKLRHYREQIGLE